MNLAFVSILLLKLEYELKLCQLKPNCMEYAIATTKEKRCFGIIFAFMNIHIHSHWSVWYQVTAIDCYALLEYLNFVGPR